MATIGYGNIVPVTPTGRIGCVIFALIGAPLAIITIGDLGKFLSECTIWLYKRMKRGWAWMRQALRRVRANGKEELEPFLPRLRRRGCEPDIVDEADEVSQASSKSTLNWDTFVIDKTEVPVLLVFAILLLYIAFGGLLFMFLEDWSYMDAFYYSFISLTTIGFGDIVPENHDYIVVMLLYLGVGLAVTTMCIDLVGIQYIQKIHYFGRKFKGTDLLQLLKRKRAIERHLMRSGATNEQVMEVMKHVLDHIHESEPPPILLTDRWVEDELMRKSPPRTDFPTVERVPSPTIMSIRRMWQRLRSRGESWDESGPSVSDHCSLSTEPSVHLRVNYWDEYRSPQPSLLDFQFDFPAPSPDYEQIVGPPVCALPYVAFRVLQCELLERWESEQQLIGFQSPRKPMFHVDEEEIPASPSYPLTPPKAVSPPAVSRDPDIPRLPLHLVSPPLSANRTLFPIPESRRSSIAPTPSPEPVLKKKKRARQLKKLDPLTTMGWLNISPRNRQLLEAVKSDLPTLFDAVRRESSASAASSVVLVSPQNPIGLACMEEWDSYIRMLDECQRPFTRRIFEKAAKRELHPEPSERTEEWRQPETIAEMVNEVVAQNMAREAGVSRTMQRVQPRPPPRLRVTMECEVAEKALPVPSTSIDEPVNPFHADPLVNEVQTMSPERLVDVWEEEEDIDLDDPTQNYDDELSTPEDPSPRSVEEPPSTTGKTSPEAQKLNTPPPVEPTPSLMTVPEEEEGMEDEPEAEQEEEHEPIALSPSRPESSSSSEGPPPFEIDLGAFELVDSGLTAETILSNEDPVIFHKELPVHSVHHDTVQTEAALENLMAAPERMLSGMVPPAMVDDNYCFVVDGDKIRMGDIMGDDQWWRHTSRPTKYFYSDDLKKFHRVNCITAKGKVISAVLASGSMSLDRAMQSPSMSSTPRSSVSGASSRTTGHSRADQVPLEHVYKVIRFYSFWKTCTSFHRIVTMIDKVIGGEGSPHPEFKKRLFVQYLWRNAKPVDKARVQREFDPRRQRLLRFVTDPQAKKAMPGGSAAPPL
ncbi:unnamed protein product, partial [Mesorhabditis spiculigera]